MSTTKDRSGARPAAPDASLRAASELLEDRRAEIFLRWERAVRGAGGDPGAAALTDPVPELLERLAELDPERGAGPVVSATEALERAPAGGEDLLATVTRLALLRDVVIEQWESMPRGGATALRLLNQAFDRATVVAVARAAAAQARVARGFDRLAEVVSEGEPLDVQLPRLLRIVVEESSAVDGAVTGTGAMTPLVGTSSRLAV